MPDWTSFLSAMTLALVRVSGMVAFAPFFSSTALPLRTKAVFVGAVAFLLAPLVAALPNAQATISFSALLGELAVGLVYGSDADAAERDAALCRADCRACSSASRWSICWTRPRRFRRLCWATCFS